ncbi:DUF4238 domain-containing protein [Candidatus Woesebacteria bacterium]|nr:DUF4238 domain-containing protein [Candidatus Woesebacteria bacterium]
MEQTTQYQNNHYVPVWYQKRFLPPGQKDQELYYLDLNPGSWTDPRGIVHPVRPVGRLGFKFCFCEDDLYTRWFGEEKSTAIEERFFGRIDHRGRPAVEYFTGFTHPSVDGQAFGNMMTYMSTQKLRTPKGLEWLAQKIEMSDHDLVLSYMIRLRNLHCALWTECIWQIADASQSPTKFIVSDHPVTVYNRECGPRNKRWCRGANDPDIALNGTHTIFPLTLDKVLILTNLSWVRDPYQSAVSYRPNPNPFRDAIFSFMDIQTMRYLTEQEVREINFIIKSRAYKHIAAAKEEWLYPEEYVSKSQWNVFGDGYLMMPDPRPVNWGGEIIIGHHDGSASAFDEYGRRPWEQDYNRDDPRKMKYDPLNRFKGEFAQRFGPKRRGRSFNFARLDPEIDSDDFHQYHLRLTKKKR